MLGAFVVGAAFVLLAVYSVVDILTIHIPDPNSTDGFAVGLSQGASMSDRLSVVLPQIGTVLIGLVAMIGANRFGNIAGGSRETSGFPPDWSVDGDARATPRRAPRDRLVARQSETPGRRQRSEHPARLQSRDDLVGPDGLIKHLRRLVETATAAERQAVVDRRLTTNDR
jgi:hypothetical protein